MTAACLPSSDSLIDYHTNVNWRSIPGLLLPLGFQFLACLTMLIQSSPKVPQAHEHALLSTVAFPARVSPLELPLAHLNSFVCLSMCSANSACAWAADCFKWAIYFAIASVDDCLMSAIPVITLKVSTPTQATFGPDMSHNVFSSKPSSTTFSTPPTRVFLRFRVLLITASRLQLNLYSLSGINSSRVSNSGPLDERGVNLIGSINACDSPLVF